MKPLNRAIARTVSQIARHAGEGCHVPMIMALENHLDALLTMERKQLEQAGIKIATLGDKSVVNITNTGCTGAADAKVVAAHILRELGRNRVPGGVMAFSTPQTKGRTAWERYLDSGVVSDDLIKGLGLKREDGPEFVVPNERAGRAAEQPVPVEPGLHIDVGDVLTRTSGGQFGRWTFGADYRVIEVPADGYVTVYDDSGYPRVMSAGVARSNFTVSKKQTEPTEPAPPAPDVIDMTDPANWQEGDILLRTGADWLGFYQGREYQVAKVIAEKQEIHISRDNGAVWTSYTFDLLRDDEMFTWLRHGEAQA